MGLLYRHRGWFSRGGCWDFLDDVRLVLAFDLSMFTPSANCCDSRDAALCEWNSMVVLDEYLQFTGVL